MITLTPEVSHALEEVAAVVRARREAYRRLKVPGEEHVDQGDLTRAISRLRFTWDEFELAFERAIDAEVGA